MKASVSTHFKATIVAILLVTSYSMAFSSSDENEDEEAQVVSGITLPHWREGECRESFDARIWPGSVKIWLEQENLRTLISDPATPEAVRQSLKRILAMQRAWRSAKA